MAYSDGWTDTSPPGTTAAGLIDDEFRKLRLQIHERMNSLVVDWTADPVVPLNSTVGPRTVLVPNEAFVSNGDSSSPIYELGYITSSNPVRAGISNIIPANSTITLLEWLVNKGTAATLKCQLEHADFDLANALAVDNLITTAIAGIQLLVTAPLTIVLDPAKYYSLNVFSDVPAIIFLFAARVTYTLPT